MNHQKQRVNDQYHCSCGLQWDIDEADPHRTSEEQYNVESGRMHRAIGNRALIAIKENLNRE